ncbi:hypothetical protein N9L26_02695 [Candidatus Pacebacteria bacterium]|nr:hypothetical protein [Candidatus Paceibacterota bacterium]
MHRWYLFTAVSVAAGFLGYYFLTAPLYTDQSGIDIFRAQWYPIFGFVSAFTAAICGLLAIASVLSQVTAKDFARSKEVYIGCVTAALLVTALVALSY